MPIIKSETLKCGECGDEKTLTIGVAECWSCECGATKAEAMSNSITTVGESVERVVTELPQTFQPFDSDPERDMGDSTLAEALERVRDLEQQVAREEFRLRESYMALRAAEHRAYSLCPQHEYYLSTHGNSPYRNTTGRCSRCGYERFR